MRERSTRPWRLGHEPDGGEQRQERHGRRDEERPPPADLGQQAAEHEAEREAARGGGGVHAERLVAGRALRERRRDDRERCGRGERRAQALHEAGRDEQRPVGREPAERGRDDEDAERDRGTRAAARRGRPRGHRAAGNRRSRARTRSPPTAASWSTCGGRPDRGQGDTDHRDVERVEEDGGAENEKCAPGAPGRRALEAG